MSREYMPIMTGMKYELPDNIISERKAGNHFLVISVPWAMMESHEAQAQANHSQSLEKLASRGGLSPCEAIAILEDRPWRKMTNANSALSVIVRLWLEYKARSEMSPEDMEELGDSLSREAARRSTDHER